MQKPANRKPSLYLILSGFVILLGLSSRHFAALLPEWVNLYLGDGLWALMIFFLVGLLFRTKATLWVAVAGLSFCYLIELSQLYHAPWIDAVRGTTIGGLVLGQGFLWSDMLSYSAGIAIGTAADKLLQTWTKQL